MHLGSGCGAVGRAVFPTPEIRGSYLVIGNFIYYQLYQSYVDKKKIKKKEAANSPKKRNDALIKAPLINFGLFR